jgi:peptidoglycan/xylan/chitin deacetylase (PgdA/CDA1 family)
MALRSRHRRFTTRPSAPRRFPFRRAARIGGLLVLLLAGTAYGLWTLSRARCFQVAGPIVCRVDTTERVVALTFDDGPTPAGVDFLLPVLAEAAVPATFFLIGRELEHAPALGRRLVEAGHQIANHSYSHRRMLLVSADFVRDELDRTDALLRAAGATGPIPFRPPYMKKLITLPRVLAETGRVTVTADVEPEGQDEAVDEAVGGTAADPAAIVAHVRANVRPGSIILLHPMYLSGEVTRQAVAGVIQALKADGYRFVTIAELLASRSG